VTSELTNICLVLSYKMYASCTLSSYLAELCLSYTVDTFLDLNDIAVSSPVYALTSLLTSILRAYSGQSTLLLARLRPSTLLSQEQCVIICERVKGSKLSEYACITRYSELTYSSSYSLNSRISRLMQYTLGSGLFTR